jgi:hypothetical protein
MAKIIYNALLLTPESQAVIKRKFPGKHPNYYGEHITLEFAPKFMPDNVGDEIIVDVIGHSFDISGEALVVSLNTMRSANDVPHITISTANGIKPYYSNKLLQGGFEPLDAPFKIRTHVSSFVAGQGHITNP